MGQDLREGAAAVLFNNEEEEDLVWYRLGSDKDHEVYEGECIGLTLGLHLVQKLEEVEVVSIWADNMAAITVADTRKTGPAHYLLDIFHLKLTELHKTHPGLCVCISWVPGHTGNWGNECADQEAKKAAQSRSSIKKFLPSQLHKKLPHSQTAIVCMFQKEIKEQHNTKWRKSPRYWLFRQIDNSDMTSVSRQYWKLSQLLPRKLGVVLTQLRTNHIPLQKHLHRIKQADSPICQCCRQSLKTVFHFLFQCPAHKCAREQFQRKVIAQQWNLGTILTTAKLLPALFQYVDNTKHFHHLWDDLLDLDTEQESN